jgi:DNA-binding response OmpR family regulator
MQLLLVEDDPTLGDGLYTGLAQAGFAVEWVRDGALAEQRLAAQHFALVVLDLGLPGLAGDELLRRLRALGNAVPVLILTARDATAEKIRALDAGADDYLVKPIDLDELAARIRALLRRAGGRASPLLDYPLPEGLLSLDPLAHTLQVAGQAVSLSRQEFTLLQTLLENTGRVLTRTQLEQTLYGWAGEVDSNALEVHIHHLRKKLGSTLIRTLRGVGYMIPKAQS